MIRKFVIGCSILTVSILVGLAIGYLVTHPRASVVKKAPTVPGISHRVEYISMNGITKNDNTYVVQVRMPSGRTLVCFEDRTVSYGGSVGVSCDWETYNK
jgi:hypothetical protein